MKFVVSVVFVFVSALGVARAADDGGGGDLPLGGCYKADQGSVPPVCVCKSGHRSGWASCQVKTFPGGSRCHVEGICTIESPRPGILLP